MSKLLAIVALAFCFTNAKADNLSDKEPFKALGNSVMTLGYKTPVALTQKAWARVQANAHDLNLLQLIAEDFQCMGSSLSAGKVLQTPACTIEMGGKFVTAVWSTAGLFVADAAEIALNGVTDIIGSWARAFDACYATLNHTVGAVVGLGCKVISFVLDAAGTIIQVVGQTALAVTRAVVNGVSSVLKAAFALPVAILKGDIQSAFKALFNVARAVVTCVIPVIPLVLAIVDRKKLAQLCSGN